MTIVMHSQWVSYLLVFLLVRALAGNKICYDPGGSEVAGDIPCSNTTAYSTCCGAGWSCLQNLLCQYTGDTQPSLSHGTLVRGTCTDPLWKSSSCAQVCLAGDDQNNGNFIKNCNNGTGCCQINDQDCSCAAGSPQALSFGTIDVLDSNAVSYITSIPSSTSTTTPTSSTGSAITAAGGSTTPTSTPITASSSQSSPVGQDVGIAVGVVAFVALSGALAFFFLRWRRRSKSERGGPGFMKIELPERSKTLLAEADSEHMLPWELRADPTPRHELGGNQWRSELSSEGHRGEYGSAHELQT